MIQTIVLGTAYDLNYNNHDRFNAVGIQLLSFEEKKT